MPRPAFASSSAALVSSIATLVLASAAPGAAVCTIDPEQSAAQLALDLELAMPGFLIGDYDEVANPDGTLTRPGLFGGSGNLPVDMTLSPRFALDASAAPTGSTVAAFAFDPLVLNLSGTTIDLLGGGVAAGDLELGLLYETFRTFNPNSLFPGGIELPIPIGAATVSNLVFTQVAPAVAPLAPTEDPGLFTTSILVVGTLSANVDVLGQNVPVPALPFALPLEGTVRIGNAIVILDLAAAQSDEIVDEGPFEGVGFADLPLELPTVLPPGGVAGLLLTAELASIAASSATELHLVAIGYEGATGDVNGDGVVDFADLLLVLSAWGDCGVPCPEDLDGDGLVGMGDLMLVFASWS